MKCLTIFLKFLILCHVYVYVSSIRSLLNGRKNGAHAYDAPSPIAAPVPAQPASDTSPTMNFFTPAKPVGVAWNNGGKIGAQAYAAFSPKAPK